MDESEEKRIESSIEAVNPVEEIHEEIYQRSGEKLFHINFLPNEIFECIFRNLNYRDLLSAAMVCRTWSKNANYEKGLRIGPYSSLDWYTQSNFASIKQSTIKPFVGFFFLREGSNSACFDGKETICTLLPTNCKTIMLYTCAISFNELEVSSASNDISADMVRSAMVFALLPQISNVQISMVVVQNRELSLSQYTHMIETAVKQSHNSYMCIILFYSGCNRLAINMARIAYLRFHNNKRVSFFGGEGYKLITQNETSACEEQKCAALLITGSMQTWSIVLEEETMDLAKEKLQIFKEQVQLQKYTVGFAFISEKLTHSNQKCRLNKLLAMFRKLFPKVSLIGCSCPHIFAKETATYEEKFLGSHSIRWFISSLSISISFTILTYG